MIGRARLWAGPVLKILILGGTAEAVELGGQLVQDKRFHPITSLAGRTLSPAPSAGERRVGGFGGVDGLAAYLKAENIAAIIDVTHPYAARISGHAVEASVKAGRPLARYCRATWQPTDADNWIKANSVEEAAEKVPPGCCVFVTTGRQELAPFWKRKDVWLLVRVIDPLKVAIDSERGIVIAARGPFSIESEIDLMGKHQITWLVSKNSGGPSTYAKIEAARALGLPVIMVARPKPIDDSGEQHDSIQGIIDWLERVVD